MYFFYFSEIQTSADVRPRVRETVVRVRVRNAALRPVVSVTPNVQQLHDLLPFHCPNAGYLQKESISGQAVCLYYP